MTQLAILYKESIEKEKMFSYIAESLADRMQGRAATEAFAIWLQKNNIRKNPDGTQIKYEEIQDFMSVMIQNRKNFGTEGN